MKIKKWILIISGILFVISLFSGIVTSGGSKLNNIIIGIMGSSLVAFIIEIPDFYIEYIKSKNSFLNIAFNIWNYLNQYLFYLNNILKNNNEVLTENSFLQNIDAIDKLFMEFNYIDNELYVIHKKYKNFLNKVNNINFELNHNKLAYRYFVNLKEIELIKTANRNNLKVNDFITELNTLIEKTKMKLDFYEGEFTEVLNPKELKEFQKNKDIINNTNKNFQENEIKFV